MSGLPVAWQRLDAAVVAADAAVVVAQRIATDEGRVRAGFAAWQSEMRSPSQQTSPATNDRPLLGSSSERARKEDVIIVVR